MILGWPVGPKSERKAEGGVTVAAAADAAPRGGGRWGGPCVPSGEDQGQTRMQALPERSTLGSVLRGNTRTGRERVHLHSPL